MSQQKPNSTSQSSESAVGNRLPANLEVTHGSPLFSFDLNFDSLKQFLDKTTATINQHAELINALQVELATRPTHKILPEQLAIISEGGRIMDTNLEKAVKTQTAKILKSENTGDNLTSQSNKIFNKLTALGYAAAYNYSSMTSIPGRFEAIEKEITKKAVKEEVKEKHKKLKTRLIAEIDEIKKYFDKKILDIDVKYTEKISVFEDRIQGVEKKTLWKIQDCEEMLKKRITEEYVDDSCKVLEDKIRRELLNTSNSDGSRMERITAEILGKMKFLEDSQSEKSKNHKKLIKDLEEIVNSSCVKQQIFEELKKNLLSQLEALTRRQKELDGSLQIQPILERQNIRIKATDDRLNDLAENMGSKIQEITLFVNSRNATKPTGNPTTDGAASNLDPHKLCQIEGDLGRAKEDLKKHQQEIDQIKATVQTKLDNIDLNVYEAGMSRVGGNNNSSGGSSLQDMMNMITDLREQIRLLSNGNENGEREEIRKAVVDIKEMSKRMESLKDLERRMQRIFKELDLNGLQRSLKQKAESDDVLKDFAIVDTKINSNNEQIGFCRKDIDNLILLYKKLLQALQNNNGNTGDLGSMISTKKLVPFNQLNCLSCGTAKVNQPGRGIDGKMYKTDMSAVNEATQSYDQGQMRNIFHGSAYSQSTQQLQRPRTAQARNETQPSQLQQQQQALTITNNSQVVQKNTSQTNLNARRNLRPESAKK